MGWGYRGYISIFSSFLFNCSFSTRSHCQGKWTCVVFFETEFAVIFKQDSFVKALSTSVSSRFGQLSPFFQQHLGIQSHAKKLEYCVKVNFLLKYNSKSETFIYSRFIVHAVTYSKPLFALISIFMACSS